jgi:transcription elongation factor Elf1
MRLERASEDSVLDCSIDERVAEVHQSDCPVCGQRGPIDVAKSYWVWSAVIFTRWGSKAQVCCRTCARSSQMDAIGSSVALGWWGFPFGLILTPIQIGRNVYGLLRGSPASSPSSALREVVQASVRAAQRFEQSLPCPHCGAHYVLSDYREDANRILCSACNGELPLPRR